MTAQYAEGLASNAFEKLPHLNIVGIGRRRRPIKQVAAQQQSPAGSSSTQRQVQQQQLHRLQNQPAFQQQQQQQQQQQRAMGQSLSLAHSSTRHVHGPQCRQGPSVTDPRYFMRSVRRDLDGRETVMAAEVTDFQRIRNAETESDVMEVVANSNRLVKARYPLQYSE
jgi:hypothetical protein